MTLSELLRPVQLWWLTATDQWHGRAPKGARRSSRWPSVRAAFLAEHPVCECCGSKIALEVHHIEPFHVRPELELEPSNLITLCESGKHGLNCHLLMGHVGNYRRWNPIVRIDVAIWRRKLDGTFTETLRESVMATLTGASARH